MPSSSFRVLTALLYRDSLSEIPSELELSVELSSGLHQVTGRSWSGFGFDKVKWTFLLLGGLRNELARKGLLGDLLLFGDLCGVFLYD